MFIGRTDHSDWDGLTLLEPGRYSIRVTYTYRSKQVAGNGWVLVGNAVGFIDPLYSSGVLLALKSGELTPSSKALPQETPQRRNSANGGRPSTKAWIESAVWSANTTTALASGISFGSSDVWKPMESTYEPGRPPIPPWDAGTPAEQSGYKVNELMLPEGPKP